MKPLRLTSCLAANTDRAGRALARYISAELSVPAEFVADMHWNEREELLEAGAIDLGWICGLLYVWKAAQPGPPLELLAAPVLAEARYQNEAVYYSDVVVASDSPYHTFADLRGARWAYNEPRSFSGYYIVGHHLAGRGESLDFFGQKLESGAHVQSLQMVVDGAADTAIVDSSLLDYELRRRPELARQIRVIETLGPSPVPPWVVSRRLPADLRQELRQLLLGMAASRAGREALAEGGLLRFAAVTDAAYDPIRRVAGVMAD